MQDLDDIALLQEFTENNSEEAFALLVSRHVNKIYSAALRQTRNPHHAEEITQAVFVILARKAPHSRSGPNLSGWLYHTTRLTAVTFVRSEIRRARREHEAHMNTLSNASEPAVWQQPGLLQQQLDELAATDIMQIYVNGNGEFFPPVLILIGFDGTARRFSEQDFQF